MALDDRLEQCLTTSKSKMSQKSLSAQIWVKQAKVGSKISFFFIFSSLVHWFFFITALGDRLEQCLITRRGKICQKLLSDPNWVKWAKIGPKFSFFVIFINFDPLVFLEIS